MNKKLFCKKSFALALSVAFSTTLFGSFDVKARTLSNEGIEVESGLTAEDYANSLLGEGVTINSATLKYSDSSQIGIISNANSLFGFDEGVILATGNASKIVTSDDEDADYHGWENQFIDLDLKDLIVNKEQQVYGGDTVALEFELTANGSLLNFNYAFASAEFTEYPEYNDIFGLFVSVNGSDYENIALLPAGNPVVEGKYVTINNLRENGDSLDYGDNNTYTYFQACVPGYDDETQETIVGCGAIFNGVSNVFNAQKAVTVGDKVKVKLVIADVGDSSVSSAVVIQANSLSFDAPGAKIDYNKEVIKGLDEGTYEISVEVDGKTYTFNLSKNSNIPFSGKDANGVSYNFVGKEISIVKCITQDVKSDATKVKINTPPKAPDPIKDSEVESDVENKTVTVKNPVEGNEYIIVPVGTKLTRDMWKNAVKLDAEGNVIFAEDTEGNAFAEGIEYIVYSRVAATNKHAASEPSVESDSIYFGDAPTEEVTTEEVTTEEVTTEEVTTEEDTTEEVTTQEDITEEVTTEEMTTDENTTEEVTEETTTEEVTTEAEMVTTGDATANIFGIFVLLTLASGIAILALKKEIDK